MDLKKLFLGLSALNCLSLTYAMEQEDEQDDTDYVLTPEQCFTQRRSLKLTMPDRSRLRSMFRVPNRPAEPRVILPGHTLEEVLSAIEQAHETGDNTIVLNTFGNFNPPNPEEKNRARASWDELQNSAFYQACQGETFFREDQLAIFTPETLARIKRNLLANGRTEEDATECVQIITLKIEKNKIKRQIADLQPLIDIEGRKDAHDLIPTDVSIKKMLKPDYMSNLKKMWTENGVGKSQQEQFYLFLLFSDKNNQLEKYHEARQQRLASIFRE